MKTLVRLMAVSAGTLGALAIPSCTSTCEEEGNCGNFKPDDATGGKAGAGGSGGSGATGGSAGNGAGGATGGASGRGGNGGEGGEGGDPGTGGGGGMGGGEPPCDTTGSPSVESCIVSDEHAVFVSPDGNDTDDGTMAAPVSTFTRALELAGSAKVVIACSGTYDEHVQITAGARVYGSFDCDNGWAYTPADASVIEPSDAGYPLQIRDVEAAVVIEDLELVAPDAQAPSESSIGAFVANSDDVTLRRMRIEAGVGANGTNGALTGFSYPTRVELGGNSANATNGGVARVCACPGGAQTSGGAGGNAAIGGQGGGVGTPALGAGKGGSAGSACASGGGGGDGANAADAARAIGAMAHGSLSASGWTPTAGGDGVSASPGQGGGGGAATTTGGGGGGGCGSCGGAGGKGGTGAGGSIALVIVGSLVAVEDSELVAADGGDGGDGAAGQAGQPEFGFAGAGALGGCGGGNGGLGGRGAAGGGGAGGISVAVLWKADLPPALSASTIANITTGTRGSGGSGGDPGMNDGIVGVAEDVLEAD